MRCVFNIETRAYCDREDSFVNGPPKDAEWIKGGNVIGRNGGVEADYVVVETSDPMPQLCKLVDGKVVRDSGLETAKADADAIRVSAEADDQAKAVRCAEIKAKAAEGTATLPELNEFVANL